MKKRRAARKRRRRTTNKAVSRHQYYMGIAIAVRKKANCLGRKIGAIIVKANRIISTGYNGTPEGVKNCMDGGCVRCKNNKMYETSVGYDVCICVHAEQNAMIAAARFGNSIENSVVYSTMRPCFDCTKAMLQAKVKAVYYLHPWQHKTKALRKQYEQIQKKLGVHQIILRDPEKQWANSRGAKPPPKTI